jgi:hypothetical protein
MSCRIHTLRIAPPRERVEEVLAQDFFSDEIGRTLAFDGSRYFTDANYTLAEISQRLPNLRVAYHALIALRMPDLGNMKKLESTATDARFQIIPANRDRARVELEPCLSQQADIGAETLGHIDYNDYVHRFASALDRQDDRQLRLLQPLRCKLLRTYCRGVVP